MPVREVAGVVATVGLVGVLAATIGALVGGFLSDKLQRRRLFVMIAAVLFVAGAVLEATAWTLPQIIAGAVVMQLSIAVFATVDQAIVYAIIPERNEAGRYMAVIQFAQKIPSAIAPMLAGVVITLGAIGGEKNYTLLYLAGGVFALVGGLIILLKVKSIRYPVARPHDTPCSFEGIERPCALHPTTWPSTAAATSFSVTGACAAALVEGPRGPRHPHRLCRRGSDRRC